MYKFLILSFFIGVFSALIGLFYRNIMKGQHMILNYWYYVILQKWAYSDNKFLSFISRPLGYCCYCYTFWIALALYIIMLTTWYPIKWQYILFGLVIAEGVQHFALAWIMKSLIKGMKDFDPETWKDDSRPIIKGFHPEIDPDEILKDNEETKETEENK